MELRKATTQKFKLHVARLESTRPRIANTAPTANTSTQASLCEDHSLEHGAAAGAFTSKYLGLRASWRGGSNYIQKCDHQGQVGWSWQVAGFVTIYACDFNREKREPHNQR
jgi:hypothetical protein